MTGIDSPAALSVIAPYPVFCGFAVPAVPAARYCKRSFLLLINPYLRKSSGLLPVSTGSIPDGEIICVKKQPLQSAALLFKCLAVIEYKRTVQKQHVASPKIHELSQIIRMHIPDIRQRNLRITADKKRRNG